MKRFQFILTHDLARCWGGVLQSLGLLFCLLFSFVLSITIQNRPKGRRTKSAVDLDFQPRLIGLTLFNWGEGACEMPRWLLDFSCVDRFWVFGVGIAGWMELLSATHWHGQFTPSLVFFHTLSYEEIPELSSNTVR
jgi:hypothetical protein